MTSANLSHRAQKIRRHVWEMIYQAQSGHPAGSLDIVDILVTLYFAPILKYRAQQPQWPERDYFLQHIRLLHKTSHTTQLEIISRRLNRWYPHIIFYDNELNILDVRKVDKATKRIRFNIPDNCIYIMVKDIYNLVNIKRGLTVIVR